MVPVEPELELAAEVAAGDAVVAAAGDKVVVVGLVEVVVGEDAGEEVVVAVVVGEVQAASEASL